jgi:hypothetical protein
VAYKWGFADVTQKEEWCNDHLRTQLVVELGPTKEELLHRIEALERKVARKEGTDV